MATTRSPGPSRRSCDLADIGDFRIAHGDIQGTLAAIERQAQADFGTSSRSAATTR